VQHEENFLVQQKHWHGIALYKLTNTRLWQMSTRVCLSLLRKEATTDCVLAATTVFVFKSLQSPRNELYSLSTFVLWFRRVRFRGWAAPFATSLSLYSSSNQTNRNYDVATSRLL